MSRFILGIIIYHLLTNIVLAGQAEDKYWDEYSTRLIESRKICVEQAKKNGSFNSEIFDECTNLANAFEKDFLKAVRAKDEKDCDSMRARIKNSKARAKTNAGNFLLGIIERQMENMSCY